MICALLGLVLIQSNAIQLPDSTGCAGWKASSQKVVTPKGIFDYMNGAGELYLAYGLKELYVREYEKPGEPKVTCEAYLLPTSADAYGLLSQDRTGEALKIGQGAVYGYGLLMAWQGKWFVRVIADRETPEAKRCVISLARKVVKLCGPSGDPPAAVKWLPKTGLDPLSIHYFHTHSCLNFFHFVSTNNLLNLSGKTDAVMGTYSGKAGKSLVLAVGYPKDADATAAWAKFRRTYLKGLRPEKDYSLVKLENGRWLGGSVKGNRLYVVLESPAREECLSLIKSLVK